MERRGTYFRRCERWVGEDEDKTVRASKMKKNEKGRGLSAKRSERMNTEGGDNGEWRLRGG
jgi:hypothetical protein